MKVVLYPLGHPAETYEAKKDSVDSWRADGIKVSFTTLDGLEIDAYDIPFKIIK